MRNKNLYSILIFVSVFAFGIFRFYVAYKASPNLFDSQIDVVTNFSGIIVDEPDIRENNQKLTVLLAPKGLALKDSKARPFSAIKILVTTNFDEDFKYGDEFNLTGKLEKPENFITDQGKNFDYINYLKKDGILYVMSYPRIEVISRGNGNTIKSALFFVKEKFLEKLNWAIPIPDNLLMNGLILGEKSAFSPELRQEFVNTGTIHIVALSGYNVMIVAEWFMKVLRQIPFLPQNFGIGAGIFAIFLFILMTGGSSTAIRAGIMAVLALFARATGRNYDAGRALILAGVIMVLINPLILFYDVSFQLSFIATIAVIFFAPKIEKYFQWVPKRFGLRDIVSVTSAVYIFVLPFILYKMGNLSLVALPANILILPFIPFTMLLGFLTSLFGVIWYGFSIPLGYISYLMLHYELGVIGFLSKVPFASLSIPDFPFILTILIYAYFFYKLFGQNCRKVFAEI